MPAPAPAPVTTRTGHHGAVRGADQTRPLPLDGRFGEMFPHLPAAKFDPASLMKLGDAMTADRDADTPEKQHDDEENTGISAGYTYLGQFIDHDLTFDPISSLDKKDDPKSLIDFRTPRFDLDCVYGRGPSDSPFLYRADGLHMLLGTALTGNPNDPNARMIPRNSPEGTDPARGLLGDPRNDENIIVSQLQSSMLRFHNRVVDFLGTGDFDTAQQTVRYHYQWVVLNDFLPTIIGDKTWKDILPHIAKGTNPHKDPPRIKFFKFEKGFIPIEFTAAAYRFGHSMVRPVYRLNQVVDRLHIFAEPGDAESLAGFRAFPSNFAIDWNLFFKSGTPPDLGPTRLQPAYKIDTSVVNPLGSLPPSVASNPASLAQRNLLRGFRMGLPNGQAVAKEMGEKPISDDKLTVGKATAGDTAANPKLTDIAAEFKGNAPLWYYVLAEAQQQFQTDTTPIHLGPVGGRIVGETIVGLMLNDPHSYLREAPHFKPIPEFLSSGGNFRMADLLAQARLA
jgi:hypothetical protein